ncbi:MAG: M1 family metallopeptidase [Planctomycetota bacterium]|jgi:hypothetical protein
MHRALATALSVLIPSVLPAQDRVLPYPVTEPDAYAAAIAAGTRSAQGAPGASYWTDAVSYRIDAELDPAAAVVRGVVEGTYTNRGTEAVTVLWMHLRQNLHKVGQMRTRVVAVTDGITLGEVSLDGNEINARAMGTRMALRLRGGLEPGASATVRVEYSYPVPVAGTAPRNGHEDNRVFYLGYWYPQFAVRDDVEGWVCEEYRGNGEFYMPYGNYDVTFRAPAGFLVRSTGVLQNAGEILHDTALDRLAAARTSRDVQPVISKDDLAAGRVTKAKDGVVAWHFVAENVRDVAVSVSNNYVWDATHAVVPGREEPVEIHAVYEPTSSTWPEAARAARFTIEWMSREVFPYPWPHMTACEGIIGGGMEFPMMTLIGDSRSVRGLEGIVAHELIHMWFPMIVGTNEKRHSWQDEGTTSFFTDLVEAAMRDAPQTARASMLGYIRTARRGSEAPLMTHADYYPVGYGFASYTKPAALLHQLRELMRSGDDDVFMTAIRTYVQEWAYKHPTPYDLFRTMERFAGRDLDWYWQPWYFEVRKLDHAVASVETEGDELVVTIEDRGFIPHPCTVEARYAEGRSERQVIGVDTWLGGAMRHVLRFPAGARTVLIDPDRDTLDIEPDNNVWQAEGR